MEQKEIKSFGESKNKNFKVKDSIGVPHPYCITPTHLKYNEGMYLDIEETEKKGAKCGICKGKLTYKEHEQALIIECKKDFKKDEKLEKELREYLNKIKGEAEKKKYAGFTFMMK